MKGHHMNQHSYSLAMRCLIDGHEYGQDGNCKKCGLNALLGGKKGEEYLHNKFVKTLTERKL